MNISQMMRGLLGEAVAGETRTMELRTGQIVRGVVTQVMENNEALVNINGVQVRARLEMPLQAGQSALLQVQPESTGSLIVLKNAETGSPVLMEDTLRDFAKQLGLPDQRWATELIKDLRKEGFPFNRATAEAFQQAAAAMPPGENQEQWMNAAAAAFKRGLPMTAATIASVGQTMHGTSVHALLDGLQRQLTALLQQTGGEALSPETRQGVERLLLLLQKGETLLQNGTAGSKDGGASTTAASTAGSNAGAAGPQGQGAAASAQTLAGTAAGQQPGQQPGIAVGSQSGGQAAAQTQPGTAAATPAPNAGLATAGSAPAATAAGSAAATAAMQATAGDGQDTAQAANGQVGTAGQGHSTAAPSSSTNWLGQMMKWLGVDHELQLARAVSGGDNAAASATAKGDAAGQPSPAQAGGPAQQTSSQSVQTNAAQPGQGSASPAAAQGQPPSASGAALPGNAGMITPEPRAAEAAASGQGRAAAQGEASQQAANAAAAARTAGAAGGQAAVPGLQAEPAANSTAPAPGPAISGAAASAAAPLQDSLKSALMSLAGGSDVPPAVKETIQSLIHHITGQQLLLSPERNSSLFTHVTMFIPLKDQDGGGTASVHIQTRRGRKGELDADNCRLLFNLSMKALGDTLVDVQITDKIVSLNLWNDHPGISGLLESSRGEMAERMQGVGYQLLSLRSNPFPAQNETAAAAPETPANKRQAPPDISQFSSTRYKGVDFRV
ncbi:DNA polymerase III subunit gamma/tau domain-containing protein [Paenibacillus sp. CAU 1782]